jgi:ABC-type branched-subunit amino acid transport system permease subunit
VRERVRSDVLRYAQIMTDREWPLMRRGGYDAAAGAIGMDATNATGTFVPANSGQSNAQAATLAQLTIMHDARQQRIAINEIGLSWFEWLILLLGGVCIVCFCWLFGLRNQRVHLLMTAMVTTIIVSSLVLLFELQYPFRSDVGIGPGIWTDALAHIHQMQSGPMIEMR